MAIKPEYSLFVKIAFKTMERYNAMEVPVPSQYMSIRPRYLDAHAGVLPSGTRGGGVRVILRGSADLEADSRDETFSEFWQWHQVHGVGLRYLSTTRAWTILQSHDLDPRE